MKIKEIIAEIERVAPLDTALPYDNPGLIVGDDEKECTGVLLTVDATYGALKEAENNGCNLIISHHPIIFTPRKSFLTKDYKCEVIASAYVSGTAIYAAHTNIDGFHDNMAVRTLKAIGAKNVTTLFDNGFGAQGDVDMKFSEIKEKVKKLLCDDTIFTVGDENKKIKKVAMINGAGGDDECFSRAREVGADLYISGEFKHHILLEANETNYALMSVGHYASEMCFNDVLNDILQCHFDTIKIVKYYEGNPFNG